MPSFLSESVCSCLFSDQEKAFDHATGKIDEETSIFTIVRHVRESKEAMKLLLSKNQRRKIKKKCRKIDVTVNGFEDSEQSDGVPDELRLEIVDPDSIKKVSMRVSDQLLNHKEGSLEKSQDLTNQLDDQDSQKRF